MQRRRQLQMVRLAWDHNADDALALHAQRVCLGLWALQTVSPLTPSLLGAGAAAAMAAYRVKEAQPQAAAAPAQRDERPSAALPDAGRPDASAAQAAPAQEQQPAEQQPVEQAQQEPEPDRETKADSARERYLARKSKAPDISSA